MGTCGGFRARHHFTRCRVPSNGANRVPEDRITRSFAERPTRALTDQPVRVVTRSCYKVSMAISRVVVHISRSEHRVLDPEDVYYLRAKGGETEIRLRSRTPLVDVRPIGEVAPLFEPSDSSASTANTPSTLPASGSCACKPTAETGSSSSILR